VQQAHKVVMMKPVDSVAVALTDIPAGARVRVVCGESVFEVELLEPIDFGHKFAVRPIGGINLQNNNERQFWGYRRPDGRVGVRNHVLILPTITCAAQAAHQITQLVAGTVSFIHQHGCAQVGVDYEQTFRTYAGLGNNPNVYGVVVLGLGCETHQARSVAEEIARSGKPVEVVSIQDHGGTLMAIAQGARIAAAMVADASRLMREPAPVSELIVGTECGGSDACSGISANPAVGWVSDAVVDAGGTSILAETTELIGAEHLLAARAADDRVAKRVYEVIQAMESRAFMMGVDIRTGNPSPGNIRGGLSSLRRNRSAPRPRRAAARCRSWSTTRSGRARMGSSGWTRRARTSSN
jgi:Altronate dehydratase